MPYSPDDVAGLPSNVQKMDGKSRRQWCHIWNSAYQKHGSEEKAFAMANGVLKKEGEAPKPEKESEKGFSLDDGIEVSEDYDSENIESLKQFISKELSLPVEIEESMDETVNDWLVGK